MTAKLDLRCVCVTISLALAGGCASIPSAPTATVAPAAETIAVATTNQDAADDPAIWTAPAGASVMLGGKAIGGFVAGTDKKAGLYIYGLDGAELQFLPDGLLNNVDLRGGVGIAGREIVIGASDRGRMGVALYRFDPASADAGNRVQPWGFIKSDVVEPYGFCMGRWGGRLHAVLNSTDGQVRIYAITESSDGSAAGVEAARFALPSQPEGCAIDEEGGFLYIGEEARGLWRFPLSGGAGELVQAVGDGRLVADVEGVTVMKDGAARYLLVSSQGDSAFAVWRVDGPAPLYAGRFRVAAAGGIDAVSGTDGLDALGGPVGPFREGLVVVQDDENEGLSQNFKYIDWREVKKALGL